jgi:hypothetical protein
MRGKKGIEMSSKRTNPRDEAGKMASLGIAWSVLAGVAYLGIIRGLVERIKTALKVADPTINTQGLRNLHYDAAGVGSSSLFNFALTAVPFAIGAVLLLAIAARVRPQLIPVPIVLVIAALVGLVTSLLLFLNQVYTPANRLSFIVALGTVVGVWLLLRLERYVRRLQRANPAVSTLLLAVLVVAYLVAYNAANIFTLILRQIDVWLAVAAFVIVLYASIRTLQESARMQ